MRPMRSFLRYWLPLLLWMFVIFSASADAQSLARTSRFLVPILRWFNPDISPEAIETARWFVRKGAHMTEYAVLAWLAWRAVRQPRRREIRPWSWRPAVTALVISFTYAASDEFHQGFVKDRTASPVDVGIDTFGAAVALLLVWLCYRNSRR